MTTSSPDFNLDVFDVQGDPTVFGNETWVAYVFDDSDNPAPPTSNITFNIEDYRGF